MYYLVSNVSLSDLQFSIKTILYLTIDVQLFQHIVKIPSHFHYNIVYFLWSLLSLTQFISLFIMISLLFGNSKLGDDILIAFHHMGNSFDKISNTTLEVEFQPCTNHFHLNLHQLCF